MFLYHGTTGDRLPHIAEEGLRPGREVRLHGPRKLCRRAIFFGSEKKAWFYARFRRFPFFGRWSKTPGEPTLLRVAIAHLQGLRIKRDWLYCDPATFVVFSERIPPTAIEIHQPDGTWRPLVP